MRVGVYVGPLCCEKARLGIFGAIVFTVCPEHTPYYLQDNVWMPLEPTDTNAPLVTEYFHR